MLSTEKSFETFPKHKGYAEISESFALKLIITNYLLNYLLNPNLLLCLVRLIEYKFSAASLRSNPCVRPLPRIKMPFFLLSICEDEIMSTPKIITFLPTSSSIEKNPFLSNPIPYPEYL